MANTTIQIKKSNVTTTPADGSLLSSELAYSYVSDRLFIGSFDGTTKYVIGGQYVANTALGAYIRANAAMVTANAAYDAANAANNLAFSRLPLAGGTITGDLTIQGNIFTSGTVSYANTQHLMVGDNIIILNADITGATAPLENAGIEINRGTLANTLLIWDEGTDQWKFTEDGSVYYRIATNTSVETAQTRAVAGMLTANTAYDKANSANINAADASFLTTGTVGSARISGSYTGITGVGTLAAGTWNADVITVPYGGTGRNTFANNGILFGNSANGIRTTIAGTEGQVLQATNQGTPVFGMLDGGSF